MLPGARTNLYARFFFFRLFSYNVLAGLNKLGKARKDGKTKKCDVIVASFNFLISSCQLRSVKLQC